MERPRFIQVATLSAALGAAITLSREENQGVAAKNNFIDFAGTTHKLQLENAPNQEEYSRLQSDTRVVGFLEVPDDQTIQESDRQAFREILTQVQQWFYENAGATFEIGDVQFVTVPETISYPRNTEEFFENSIITRVGTLSQNSGLGSFCDKDINRNNFLMITLIGWRNQTANNSVVYGDHNLLVATCATLQDGLGGIKFSEDHLDSISQEEAVRRFIWAITFAEPFDQNAPNLPEFTQQFTPEQIEQIRTNPLFRIKNPVWQPPKEPLHLAANWNLLTVDVNQCLPIDQALKSLIDQGVSVVIWAYRPDLGSWQAYDPRFANVSDLRQLCPLQVIWIRPSAEVNWQVNP